MHATLRDALGLQTLKNAKMLTNTFNLNREIKFVDVIEVPDVFNWVRPCTFLITSAFAIRNDLKAQIRLISDLSKSGVTALAIKPERYLGKVPERMLIQANKLQFPLIELASDLIYSDLILDISKLILVKSELVKPINKNNIFVDILLQRGSFIELANKLTDLIMQPVAIEDINFNLLAYSEPTKDISSYNRFLLRSLFKNNRQDLARQNLALRNKDSKNHIFYVENGYQNYVILPIRIQGKAVGFLTIFNQSENKISDFTEIEDAATAIQLEFSRMELNNYDELFLEKQLISSLLTFDLADIRKLESQINHTGWIINRYYVSILINVEDNYKPSGGLLEYKNDFIIKAKKVLENIFHLNNKKTISYIEKNNIFFYINFVDNEVIKLKTDINIIINDIIEKTKNLRWNISIGVGTVVNNIYEIKKTHNESIKALNIGKSIQKSDEVFYYSELDIFEIIINYRPKSELLNFMNRYIGALIRYQKNKPNPNLIHTLEIYLNLDCSLVNASKILYIHRNTLIYRLDIIKEILTYDFETPGVKFKINFALKIYRCLNHSELIES